MALFNRQKAEKGKCKGQESTIGKIIYSFLLFMPLLSILVTSMYVVFNKNAYQSYSGIAQPIIVYKYETNEVTVINDLKQGNIYHIEVDYSTFTTQAYFYVNDVINLELKHSTRQFYYSQDFDGNIFYVSINYNNDVKLAVLTEDGFSLNTYNNTRFNNDTISFDFVYNRGLSSNLLPYISASTYNEIEGVENTNDTLDNVFEYSISKVEENNLYNWSKNTGTYTAISTTTNALGINNTFLPMLLTYWLIISIIYFVYDIGLMLVWVIHRKIHELQESI